MKHIIDIQDNWKKCAKDGDIAIIIICPVCKGRKGTVKLVLSYKI